MGGAEHGARRARPRLRGICVGRRLRRCDGTGASILHGVAGLDRQGDPGGGSGGDFVISAWGDAIDLDHVAATRAVIVLTPLVLLAMIMGDDIWLRAALI